MNTETMNKRCDKCGVVYNTIASPWAEEYHTNFCYGEMRDLEPGLGVEDKMCAGSDHHEPNWTVILFIGFALGIIAFSVWLVFLINSL